MQLTRSAKLADRKCPLFEISWVTADGKHARQESDFIMLHKEFFLKGPVCNI